MKFFRENIRKLKYNLNWNGKVLDFTESLGPYWDTYHCAMSLIDTEKLSALLKLMTSCSYTYFRYCFYFLKKFMVLNNLVSVSVENNQEINA